MNCIRCHAILLKSELLCPACKVIIDYSAVEAQAASMCEAATTPVLRSAARLLQFAAKSACIAEQALIETGIIEQPQLVRMELLWRVSCDRANKMDLYTVSILAGRSGADTELSIAVVLRGWAEEMMAVPRIVAQGEVPPDNFEPTWGKE